MTHSNAAAAAAGALQLCEHGTTSGEEHVWPSISTKSKVRVFFGSREE